MADLDKTIASQFLSYAPHRRTDSLGVRALVNLWEHHDLGILF